MPGAGFGESCIFWETVKDVGLEMPLGATAGVRADRGDVGFPGLGEL